MVWVRMTDKERTPQFGDPYMIQVVCRSDAEADEIEGLANADPRWSRVIIMASRVYQRADYPSRVVETMSAEQFRSGGLPIDRIGVIGYTLPVSNKGG
jgi:hypothetical protein